MHASARCRAATSCTPACPSLPTASAPASTSPASQVHAPKFQPGHGCNGTLASVDGCAEQKSGQQAKPACSCSVALHDSKHCSPCLPESNFGAAARFWLLSGFQLVGQQQRE